MEFKIPTIPKRRPTLAQSSRGTPREPMDRIDLTWTWVYHPPLGYIMEIPSEILPGTAVNFV